MVQLLTGVDKYLTEVIAHVKQILTGEKKYLTTVVKQIAQLRRKLTVLAKF
jgi:hypothetical protein